MASQPRRRMSIAVSAGAARWSAESGLGILTEPTLTPSPQSIAEKLQQHVQVVEQRVSVQEAIHALEMLELFELQKPDDEFDKENLYFLTKRRRELEDVLWEKVKRRRRNANVCKLE